MPLKLGSWPLDILIYILFYRKLHELIRVYKMWFLSTELYYLCLTTYVVFSVVFAVRGCCHQHSISQRWLTDELNSAVTDCFLNKVLICHEEIDMWLREGPLIAFVTVAEYFVVTLISVSSSLTEFLRFHCFAFRLFLYKYEHVKF